jgi:hypothetical protein
VLFGQHHTTECAERCGAHRRQVAHGNVQRALTQVDQAQPVAFEVHVFHLDVDGTNELIPRAEQGGVVSDPQFYVGMVRAQTPRQITDRTAFAT